MVYLILRESAYKSYLADLMFINKRVVLLRTEYGRSFVCVDRARPRHQFFNFLFSWTKQGIKCFAQGQSLTSLKLATSRYPV